MNTSLTQFMKIALSVIVIAGLLFYVGYKMVEDEINNDYKAKIESVSPPSTSGPPTSR